MLERHDEARVGQLCKVILQGLTDDPGHDARRIDDHKVGLGLRLVDELCDRNDMGQHDTVRFCRTDEADLIGSHPGFERHPIGQVDETDAGGRTDR